MTKEKKILKNYLLYFLLMILVCIVGVSGVFADTISDYSTKYYYYNADDNSSTNSTVYRTGDNNFVTLFGAQPPTYTNGEGFNGFYNQINYKIVKGSIYTLTLNVQYTNLQDSEFSRNDINNRLLKTDFAHCDGCNITAVSGSFRRYNNISGIANNLYDFVVQMSYTFVATTTTNTFYIGSYTGDDRVLGVDNHLYNSIVSVYSLEINENNSSTIINQNDTIINQNQQIIDQNNSNKQEIINNQNQNTQEQIESQKVCSKIDKKSVKINGKYLNSSGQETSSNSYGITDYLTTDQTEYTILVKKTGGSSYYCFYNTNKTIIQCNQTSTLILNEKITIPSTASYIRFSININEDRPQINKCTNGNQALNDSISGLNDSLNNDNVDDNGIASAFEDFDNYLDDNSTITQLITLPITLYTAILNNVNGSCSPFNLGNLYGEDLILPCINISQYLGNSLWSMIDIIISGFAIYAISKKMIKIFNNFSSLREGDVIDD